MSTTPHNSKEYYWKGGDTAGITANWYYTVGSTSGLTAGFTGGILPAAVTAGFTQQPASTFSHVFTMNAVRDGSVVEVSTISGTPQTTGLHYVTSIVSSAGNTWTVGATGILGTGSLPYLGVTAGCWDHKENWLVAVDGMTNGGWIGHGYYFTPAIRPPHGGDGVWFSKLDKDPAIGLYTALPSTNLIYGGWNGATWTGSTSAVTADHSGAVIIRDNSSYDFPVGVTSGAGLVVHGAEVRLLSNSNYEYRFSAGSSLGYVLSEGTHSMQITSSTIQDLELRKSSSLNDTGQYGNFSGRGNTYSSSVSIMGYASGRFVHVAGYGGVAGFLPAFNIAPLYRDSITIDVDIDNFVVAPSAKKSGVTDPYNTVKPVNIISSASSNRRYIKELIQTPENSTSYGQVVGTQSNNPVTFSCGGTVDNHTFGAGSLNVGSATKETDEITIVDGYIGAGCIVDTIHPNNPRWVGFIIGDVHGNTQEGYLVTDETGEASFKFSRGHFVKANFGNARGAADASIVSQSGGKD